MRAKCYVYLVTHAYDRPDGGDEVKIMGVYASKHDAYLAVRRKRRRLGFRDYPSRFDVSKIEIDRDQWSEGFI